MWLFDHITSVRRCMIYHDSRFDKMASICSAEGQRTRIPGEGRVAVRVCRC